MNSIEIIRSNRKTIAIEIKSDCRVIVRAPFQMSNRDIRHFISDKADWLQKHLEIAKCRLAAAKDKFTGSEIRELADAAMKDIP